MSELQRYDIEAHIIGEGTRETFATINVSKAADGEWVRFADVQKLLDQCRAAGFIDGEGNVRKVLGTLPLTADGCVAGIGGDIWCYNAPYANTIRRLEDGGEYGIRASLVSAREADGWAPLAHCYSTRDAALNKPPATAGAGVGA